MSKVAVTSRSFSKHPVLRAELLSLFADVTFNDEGKTLVGAELISFLRGHDKAIIALEKIDIDILKAVPELRHIAKFGVGLDNFDQKALSDAGVKLSWKGGTNKRSVSELALCLILNLLRNIPNVCQEVRSGTFKQIKGGCLSGRAVGILGLGQIGKDLVELLRPFGCRILGYDLAIDEVYCKRFEVTPVGLVELFKISDVVVIHLPFNADTRNLVNSELLSLLKKDAILVNVSRGGIVDEEALKAALKSGRFAGAAFDVFATEPPQDFELLNLPNFIATPHIGGSTEEAILAMGRAAINGLKES